MSGPERRAGLLTVLCGCLGTACLPWVAVRGDADGSLGTVSTGMLAGGEQLEARGAHHRFYRGGAHRHATPELAGLVRRSAARVAAVFPDSVLLVGDISAPRGGFIGGHRSHRSGRDVDFAFFLSTPAGERRPGFPLVRLDRLGAGVRGEEPCRFDDARNWALVEALIDDVAAEVQWIFVSRGLKARLIAHALGRNRDPGLIERAATMLHQPGDSARHDDHFHVRTYCPAGPAGVACQDTGPVWPWVAKRLVTAADEAPEGGDGRLLDLALEGLETGADRP
jgi:penicillin-insensitive murein endopeptidase